MKWDNEEFFHKCTELYSDLINNKVRSSSWIFIIAGSVGALALSCFKIKSNICKPILAKINRVGEKE